ncbi:hypothetical protein H5410_064863, partial [Solanum commersonii]
MGQLAHSADHQAARLKASITGMIQTARADSMTPLIATIDALVAMTAVCEHGQGITEKVKTLKVVIAALINDVDQLKSTDMSIIFGM